MHTPLMPTSKRWLLPLLLVAATSCSDCGRFKRYGLREVPFCASDDPKVPPEAATSYHILTKWSDGWSSQPLSMKSGSPQLQGHGDEMLLAVLECGGPPYNVDGKLMESFDAKTIPAVCLNQKTLFHASLSAGEDARSKGLGQDGFYQFPKVSVACKSGKLSTNDLLTLEQIIKDFSNSIQAYVERHEGQLPKTMAELQKDTAAPDLPPDPWGQPLAFESKGNKLTLRSAGPDGKPGGGDDIAVIEIEASGNSYGSNSITVFEGTNYSMYGDYRAFINKKKP